tara:strand:- start:303 stop:1178 length:876 start_codon:yes stop_codon:yes gene_type:complete
MWYMIRFSLTSILLLLTSCIGLDAFDKESTSDSALEPFDSNDLTPLDSGSEGNLSPEADAGDDITAGVTDVVGLNGTDSYDPDGDEFTYLWTITGAPVGSTASLVNDTSPSPSLYVDLSGVFTVALMVDDGEFQDVDRVNVTVSEPNGDPIANAGSDRSVTTGDTVQLDGSGSVDPDGDPLNFQWAIVSAPSNSTSSISNGSSALAVFVADVDGRWELSLVVDDGTTSSNPDTLIVNASETGDSILGCDCGAQARQRWENDPTIITQANRSHLFGVPFLMGLWWGRRRKRS